MTKFLISLTNRKEDEAARRGAMGALSGITGIICNLLLCAVKFVVGSLAGSVSVTADAVNNLSDCATNIVTITGTRLSNKPDDEEHPFGHGRAEYIAAMIVAITIFVVGFELAKSSVGKIIHPQQIRFSFWYIAVLGATVLVKLWMAYFNGKLYKLTGNLTLKGVKQDSLNDCLATLATVLSVTLAHVFAIPWIDGAIGLGVSAFVLLSGASLLKSVISPLLGEPPSKDVTDKIEALITESDIVLGMHDLMIHNYGANKVIASADAEVDAGADVFTIHEVIDSAERKISDELGIVMCIHMDPVDPADTDTKKLKKFAKRTIKAYNPAFSFHDCRFAEKDGERYITFDLTVPFSDETNKAQIEADIAEKFSARYPDYSLDINIEHSYT